MRQNNYREQALRLITPESIKQICSVYEYSGKWQIVRHTAQTEVERMQKNAMLNNVSAGVKNNGLNITFQKVRELIQQGIPPQNEPELSVVRYARALWSIINNEYSHENMMQDIIRLNNMLYYDDQLDSHCQWRIHNTPYINLTNNSKHTHSLPEPAHVSEMFEAICNEYSSVIAEGKIDPLFVMPLFVVDFMAIQPFDRGYFEMLRLIHLYLMNWAGFRMLNTMSVEQCFQMYLNQGWQNIAECLEGWYEKKNTYQPSFDMCMALVNVSYCQFDKWIALIQCGQVTTKDVVLMIVQDNTEATTKSMLIDYLPHISESSIEKALYTLNQSGIIRRIGAGRYSEYIYCGPEKS